MGPMNAPGPTTPAAIPSTYATHTALLAPHTELASCVRGIVVRDTRAAGEMPESARLNQFPASPYAALTWILHGQSIVLEHVNPATLGVLPQISISGPQTGPSLSLNPGPAQAMMVIFMPDALHLLTGLDMSALTDQLADANLALSEDWQPMLQAVQHAPDDTSRIAALEAFLLPSWRQVRPQAPLGLNRLLDWLQVAALRAASSRWAISMRQTERRLKIWLGIPLREARGLQRGEQSFLRAKSAVLQAQTDGERVRWADHALQTGYADQSHLTRETRRMTGLSPTQLAQAVQHDESFWLYRIWG